MSSSWYYVINENNIKKQNDIGINDGVSRFLTSNNVNYEKRLFCEEGEF